MADLLVMSALANLWLEVTNSEYVIIIIYCGFHRTWIWLASSTCCRDAIWSWSKFFSGASASYSHSGVGSSCLDLVFGQQNTSVQCHVVRKRIGISGHVIVGVRLNKSTAIVNIIFMHHVIILPMGLSFVYLLFSVPRSLLNNMWPGF